MLRVLGWDYLNENLVELEKVEIKILKMKKYGKFVLVQEQNPSNNYTLVLFDVDTVHSTVAKRLIENGSKFIGAGRYRISGLGLVVEWDSETCFLKFKYDRPQDKEEADRLLGLVNQAIYDEAITMKFKTVLYF